MDGDLYCEKNWRPKSLGVCTVLILDTKQLNVVLSENKIVKNLFQVLYMYITVLSHLQLAIPCDLFLLIGGK